MYRFALGILFLFLTNVLLAQNEVNPKYEYVDSTIYPSAKHFQLNLEFGNQYLNIPQQDYFDDKKKTVLNVIGVSYANILDFEKKSLYWHLYFLNQLKEEFHISDTVVHTLSGFQLGFDFLGLHILNNSKHFDVISNIGVDFGGKKSLVYENGRLISVFQNPFTTLRVMVEPRFLFGKVKLGLKTISYLDLSPPDWKLREGKEMEMMPLKVTGGSLLISLGFRFK